MKPLNRPLALLLALVLVLGMFPAHVHAAGAAPEAITLKVWAPQQDQRTSTSWLPKMLDAFEAANPQWDITWEFDVCPESDVAYMMSSDPENAPDVFLYANDLLPALLECGALLPLRESEAAEALKNSSPELMYTVMDAAGSYYGYPISSNTWIMYYNKSILSESDVQSLEKMMEKGVVFFELRNSWYLPAFYFANGCSLFGAYGNDEAAGADFSGEKATAVTLRLLELMENPNFQCDGDGFGNRGLKNGTAVAYFSGIWDYENLYEAMGENLGAAVAPTVRIDGEDKQLQPYLGSRAIGVNRCTEHEEAARALARFLATEESQLLRWNTSGAVPAAPGLTDEASIIANVAARAQIETAASACRVQPSVPAMNSCWGPIGNFGMYLTDGLITPENAAEMTETLHQQLNGIDAPMPQPVVLEYEIYNDHVAITGYTGEPVVLEIPAEIEGLPVTHVADNAFRCCYSLEEITFPDSVKYINSYAFANCESLTTVTIPAGVTGIEGNVFAHCYNLTAVEVDAANTDYCSVNGVLYSKDMTELICCPGAFEGAFTVPASVEYADDAFDGCYELTQILAAEGNANLRSQDGMLFNADLTQLVRCPNGKGGHITIPSTVTEIRHEAFEDCARMTGVTIPDGVTGIQTAAFSGCAALTEISIPDSVESIGFSAFDSCTSLTSVKLPSGLWGLMEGVFYGCSALTDITLPDSLEYIAYSAFESCTALTSITIPDSVTYIDGYAFAGCTALTTVVLPEEIQSINYSLFAGCTNLTDIAIPDSVTRIGGDAFMECSSLHSITIPAAVSEIVDWAFAWSGLNKIYFQGDAPEFYESCFYDVTATAYYPMGNATWTSDVMQDYGGNITWIAYDPNHTHEYSAVVTNPTCTEGGYTTYTCACGESYVGDYTDALGHDLGEWAVVTAPTCMEDGTEQRNCSRCDYAETRAIEATGHSYSTVTTAPTCTEQGFTTYTCECGESYIADYTDALGHDYVDGFCTRCGEEDPDYQAPAQNPFTDVPAGSFYEAPVLWAVENGITNGASADSFNPNGQCQRAHVVTFLWRAAGQPEPESTVNPFVDVKETDFYYKAVLWAVEKGITNGLDATHFGSFAYCNRAQVVTFLYRAMGSPAVTATECPFTDVAPGAWYEAPILWAVENGITNGLDAVTFGVNTVCNRAQVVTFLYRTYN